MATTEKGIYYPDDYTKPADVPEDMKKLAESVDTVVSNLDTNKVDKVDGKGLSTNDYTNEDKAKLDSLENYDDTEITQEIEDIQAKDEVQDTEIGKQSDLTQKLKDNCINVTTEEATSLQVQDASTLPARLEVRGNHTQKTVKGIQILENTNQGTTGWAMQTSPSGLGVMEEVSYLGTRACKFKTTAEETSWMYISRNVNLSKLKNNTTYTLQMDIKTNYNEGTINVYIQDGSTTNKLADFGYVNNVNGERRIKLVATTNDTEIANQILYIGLYALDNNSSNELIITNLILVEGDYTDTDLEWEEYTDLQGSPSLDYPSEVKAVGDNVNLFPINTEYFELTENGIKNKANSAGKTITEINVKKGQTIKIGFKLFSKPSENTTFTCIINDVENSSLNIARFNNYNLNQKYEFSYIATENVTFKYVLNGNSANETFEFQLWAQINELTNYSKYGQGSVEVKKINSNIMPILNLGKDWEYTENGIKNLVQNGKRIFTINLKKGQTVRLCFKALLNPSVSTTFTMYLNGNVRDDLSFLDFYKYELNKIYTKTYTATEDCELYSILWGNANNETFEFQLWANLENAEDYQQYEESSYVLPIQKPMLSGDYFVKEADGWKEVHGWNKEFFANIINNAIISSSNMHMTIPNFSNNKALLPSNSEIANIFSNVFKPVAFANIDKVDYGIGIYYASDSLVIRNKDYATLQDYKNSLNNEDFYFYYKLATPTKLPCTEAQSNVLDQLNELELFKGTNNIITAESLALMQMQYIADTETYIDNRIDEKLANINQQILEIAGGN